MWPEKLQEMPRVKAVMTPFPYSIEQSAPLSEAQQMMAKHRIHHLPVMKDGNPVGVISNRDLQQTLSRSGDDPHRSLLVADVPRDAAYVVDLSEPLDRVLASLARKRLGAALVVKDGRLAGIFTLTDAYRCFAAALRRQFPASDGDEAA